MMFFLIVAKINRKTETDKKKAKKKVLYTFFFCLKMITFACEK